MCGEFPCNKYENIDAYDSFITHQRQMEDLNRAKTIGIETYTKEQIRKREILDRFLAECNDGRKKTFYCVAVNLLPLEDLEKVLQLNENPEFSRLSMKEESSMVSGSLQKIADELNIELKLRKKPS